MLILKLILILNNNTNINTNTITNTNSNTYNDNFNTNANDNINLNTNNNINSSTNICVLLPVEVGSFVGEGCAGWGWYNELLREGLARVGVCSRTFPSFVCACVYAGVCVYVGLFLWALIS
jgi:hypothetical protein